MLMGNQKELGAVCGVAALSNKQANPIIAPEFSESVGLHVSGFAGQNNESNKFSWLYNNPRFLLIYGISIYGLGL